MARPRFLLRAAALALALAAGCYDDDGDPPAQEETCVPTTCEALGANCGAVSDGCGGMLECGECPSGQACGGGGGPNVCGSAPCTPVTCEALGATCGPVGDGCGGTLQCGDCPEGEVCGAEGRANQCGPAPCAPATCESLGANCGAVADGCGGILECGTCPAGETCGGGGAENVCGTAPCVPATCESLGANCGPVGDGCGGMLNCGECEEGTCGGGGVANQCGSPACTPTTCEAAGAECGSIGDGCGEELVCGSCDGGEVCGEDNRCGPAPCTPATCESLGAACGAAGDGCGGTLQCGECEGGQTCGGGGTPNQCGAPAPPTGGAARWLLGIGGRGDEYVAGVAARRSGDPEDPRDEGVVALTVIGSSRERPDQIGLVWISEDGAVERSIPFSVRGTFRFGSDPVAVSPSGDVFVVVQAACEAGGCTEFLGGDVTGGALVKLSPEGAVLWRVELPNGVGSNVAADAEGGAAVAESFADAGMIPVTVHRVGPGGDTEWSFRGFPEARAAVAIDAAGSVYVAQDWSVTKLDADGATLWSTRLQATDAFTFFTSIGVSGETETVVAAGNTGGGITVGEHTAPGPSGSERGAFLVGLDASDGAPAWVRSSPPARIFPPGGAGGRGADVDLAVHRDGSSALLVGVDGCNFRVERWSGLGEREWARSVDAPGCEDAAVFPSAVDVAADGDVVVGGGFQVPFSLGGKPLTPAGGTDGFVGSLEGTTVSPAALAAPPSP